MKELTLTYMMLLFTIIADAKDWIIVSVGILTILHVCDKLSDGLWSWRKERKEKKTK